jgi:glucokinase
MTDDGMTEIAVTETQTASGKEIVVADIGGTHARFALATVAGCRVVSLGAAVTLKVAEHASLPLAWAAFAAKLGRAPPRDAAFAVACPVRGDILKFTNNPWIFRPATLASEIGIDRLILINDFGAVGHAVAQAAPQDLVHIAGPKRPLPRPGVISILGPGTGLGVAQLLLDEKTYRVVETEGGHVDFAPRDAFEDALLHRLRRQFLRVSIERIVSGPGLAHIRDALPGAENARALSDDQALWAAAISDSDPFSRAALEKFCLCLGSIAGDVALTQGGEAIVLAGGLPPRIAHMLPSSGFAQRLTAKGRYAEMMADLPVWLIVHAQPGLFGAAAAFAAQET